MHFLAQDSSNNLAPAWFALVGALGGVLITGGVALLTAILNHRWQRESTILQQSQQQSKENRQELKELFLRYFSLEEQLWTQFQQLRSRVSSGDLNALKSVADYPVEVTQVIYKMSAIIVELSLIGGPEVGAAVRERQSALKGPIEKAGKGVKHSKEDSERLNASYKSLINIMRQKLNVSELTGNQVEVRRS